MPDLHIAKDFRLPASSVSDVIAIIGRRGRGKTTTAVVLTEELHARVIERLPGPERKLLSVLLAAYPNAVPFNDLAEQSGYAVNGGAFNNPRGRLRTLGLIEYQGGAAKARDILFP